MAGDGNQLGADEAVVELSDEQHADASGAEAAPATTEVTAEAFELLRRRVEAVELELASLRAGGSEAERVETEEANGAQPERAAAPPGHPQWSAYPQGAWPHPGAVPPYGSAPYPYPRGPFPQQGQLPPHKVSPQISSTVLIAGAGALIFLMGAAYFLYWSVERGYLSPLMRVLLGGLVGVGMAGGAVFLILGKSKQLGLTLHFAGLGALIFSLYYGAMVAHLFPPMLGFGAVGAVVVASAVLAVRANNQGILAVGYALGLAAPLLFSTGSKSYVLLAIYLVVLQALATVVFYLARCGGNWHAPRVLGLFGTWLLLLLVAVDAQDHQLAPLLVLALAAFVGSTVWTTLPRHPDKPELVHLMWGFANLMLSATLVALWRKLDLDHHGFGWIMLAQGAANVVAIPLLRHRTGGRGTDGAAVGGAALYFIAAMPVLFGFETATWIWSIVAVLLAGAAAALRTKEHADATTVAALAFPWVIVATAGWGYSMFERPSDAIAIINLALVNGVLNALAWALLSTTKGRPGDFAFINAEGVFHFAAGLEVYYLLSSTGDSAQQGRAALIASTVIFALSAGVQFVSSFRLSRDPWPRRWSVAAYVLFAVAATKLVLIDLRDAGTVVRALAALGIGVIFMVTALLANKLRPEDREPPRPPAEPGAM